MDNQLPAAESQAWCPWGLGDACPAETQVPRRTGLCLSPSNASPTLPQRDRSETLIHLCHSPLESCWRLPIILNKNPNSVAQRSRNVPAKFSQTAMPGLLDIAADPSHPALQPLPTATLPAAPLGQSPCAPGDPVQKRVFLLCLVSSYPSSIAPSPEVLPPPP